MLISPFLIGTSGWSFDDWKGLFYPKDLPKSKWLSFYAQHFKTVELNATFYRSFKAETYINWRESVPHDFKYVVKVPGIVTHKKLLKNVSKEILYFCDSISLLENKLGLILLQISPLVPYNLKILEKVLLTFPNREKIVVEFRHKNWMTEESKKLIQEMGCIFCSTDSPIMKLHTWVTADTAYIRLHGSKKWFDYNYSKRQLIQVAKIAKKMQEHGAQTVYIFFNNDYYAYAPYNAFYLKTILEC